MNDISLSNIKVTIIGAGLLGGSMALAIKGKCKELNGVEIRPDVIRLAMEMKLFDHISASPKNALYGSNLIILATPVNTILNIIDQLPEWITDPVIVLDLGSTKVDICHGFEKLPEHFQVIGGHPMCGKEKLGLVQADIGLYQKARFALVSLPRTSQTTKALIEELVCTIGAFPFWVDADTHDQWVAATSHLPYLLAAILTNVTPLEAANLIGPGFRSATRLAATPTSMMFDVLKSNREQIVNKLNNFSEKLSLVTQLLDHVDDDELEMFLHAAIARYHSLTGQKDEGS
jgi:prephenate dehydrogenase